MRDGLERAGQHFSAPTQYHDAPLPEALAAWASTHGLHGVVAVRPAVGPLLDLVPSVRARLAKAGVGLHLIWRPEDVATLPHARAGYFAFWQEVREDMLGGEADGMDDQTQRPRRRSSSGHSHRRQRSS